MRRVIIYMALPLTLLVVLLGFLGLRFPPEAQEPTLSVTVLCEAEGDALLLHCGEQTVLISDGTREDLDRLARYLNDVGLTQIDRLYYTGDARALASLQRAVTIRQTAPTEPGGTDLQVGPANCRVTSATDGSLTLNVEHGGQSMDLLSEEDNAAVQLRTPEGTSSINTASHSVRILCGADGVRFRPDYSAWLD